MVGGSLSDTIVTLRDADGKEEDVMIRLSIVSADMPQAHNQFRPPIRPPIRPLNVTGALDEHCQGRSPLLFVRQRSG